MEKNIKNKKKVWIILLLAVLALCIFFAIYIFKTHVEIINEIEGEYTGYQLNLITKVDYFGKIFDDIEIKKYNIKEQDIFYLFELTNSFWQLNEPVLDFPPGIKPVDEIKIKQLNEDGAIALIHNKEYTIKYNEKYNISDIIGTINIPEQVIVDGENIPASSYTYYIKIIKK